MVYSLHKNCIRIKISLYDEPIALVSPLEFMAAIGILYRKFNLQLPERKATVLELKTTALQDFSGKSIPDDSTEKILKITSEFQVQADITDDFWKTLECGYEE